MKKSQNRRNEGFSYYFCLMIEGTGSGSVSTKKTYGSQKHTDPDPTSDPQHWYLEKEFFFVF